MKNLEKVLTDRFQNFYSDSQFITKHKEDSCYLVFCSLSRRDLNKWKLQESLEFINDLEKEFNIVIYIKFG